MSTDHPDCAPLDLRLLAYGAHGLAALVAWVVTILMIANDWDTRLAMLAVAIAATLTTTGSVAWTHYVAQRSRALILADNEAVRPLLQALTARDSAILDAHRQLLAALETERKARDDVAAEEKRSAINNLDERLAAGPRPINGERYPRAVPADR